MTERTGPLSGTDDGVVASWTETVGDVLADVSIPAPIRRNALKALDRLCASALEIPAAYLEGIAAERRAETQARARLIASTTDQIAAQMKVAPQYAEAAIKKFGNRIVREQVNLDSVAHVAADNLKRAETSHGPRQEDRPLADSPVVAELDDDWLNTFEKEASQKTSGDMRLLFGRILAGEIRQPSRFSIRTVKLAGEIDSAAAKLFLRLCSLSISLRTEGRIHDARVPALGGNAGSNALSAYGLGFDQLNVLQEYGLIIPDYNSYFDYGLCVAGVDARATFGFTYQRRLWAFVSTQERTPGSTLKLHGVALSKAGRELLPVLDLEPVETFDSAMTEYFEKQGLKVVSARAS